MILAHCASWPITKTSEKSDLRSIKDNIVIFANKIVPLMEIITQ